MPGFRPHLIKVRVYEGEEETWDRFLRGDEAVFLKPTGYRDGTDGEFTLEIRKD